MTTFLLVPGGGSDPSCWRFLVAELAERGHRGIAVDLPCEDDSADLNAYADAVATQHRDDGERPIVVAHSFGGFTGALACTRVDASALIYVSAMIPRPGERPGDWWSATGCGGAQRAAAAAAGYDPDDVDALFYNGVDAAVVGEEVERAQSDTPSLKPWPEAVLPQLPTRFVLFRDDRFFPEEFMRGVVADRLGIEPEITPAGTWPCCRIQSSLPTNSSPRTNSRVVHYACVRPLCTTRWVWLTRPIGVRDFSTGQSMITGMQSRIIWAHDSGTTAEVNIPAQGAMAQITLGQADGGDCAIRASAASALGQSGRPGQCHRFRRQLLQLAQFGVRHEPQQRHLRAGTGTAPRRHRRVQLLLLEAMMMFPSSTVGAGEDVDSHYACIVYDQETGGIHHVHHVINLVGAEAPTHEEMTQRARANAPSDRGSGLTVVVVEGDQIERGKSYRVDHISKALVVEQDRTTI